MVYWIYQTVIKRVLTYEKRWTHLKQRQAVNKLFLPERVSCICIPGAIKSTSIFALEVLLPLDLLLKKDGRFAVYRRQQNQQEMGNDGLDDSSG